jgi:prevent-host-death family protein
MIKTLKESKARLSELVERASRGEDVLITVRGQVKARLTRAPAAEGAGDTAAWSEALEHLHGTYGTGKVTLTAEQIVREDRADRF